MVVLPATKKPNITGQHFGAAKQWRATADRKGCDDEDDAIQDVRVWSYAGAFSPPHPHTQCRACPYGLMT